MKKALPIIILSALAITACSRVDVGHEGIIVNKLGGEKGMERESKPVGRYWVGWNEELFVYPVYTQTRVWTDDERSGSSVSEEFNITTKDGGIFAVDIGVNFRVGEGKAPLVFEKWRTSLEAVTDTHVRRLIQDEFTKAGANYTAFEVMSKRSEIVATVEKKITSYLATYGVVIENVFMIGITPPLAIRNAMESKMKAVELTSQRQQEVEQTRAEAEKLIVAAQGKAQAIQIEGNALSANPEVLKARAIEKWDGVLPKVTGSSDVMVDVGSITE